MEEGSKVSTFKQAVSIINHLTEEQVRDLIVGGSDPMLRAVGMYRLDAPGSKWVEVVSIVEVSSAKCSRGNSCDRASTSIIWAVDEVQGRVESRGCALHIGRG